MAKATFSPELLESIKRNTWADRELDLSGQKLTVENIKALLTALENNNTIKSLTLRSCGIDVVGATAFATNTTLTTLNVGGNNIGDEGAGQ